MICYPNFNGRLGAIHISDVQPCSYADDLVLICPCAAALNDLLVICNDLAITNYMSFNTKKTECMYIPPTYSNLVTLPDIFLNGCKIHYVQEFKYLGYIINDVFSDDEDIA